MFKKICVAYDGSDNAGRAFDFALDLAKMTSGAALDITVMAVAYAPSELVDIDIGAIVNSEKQRFEGLFKDLAEKAKAQGIGIRTAIGEGYVADQLISFAMKNAIDMIILGQRGKSGIDEYMIGSVSTKVAAKAPCTVTIVK